MLGSIAFLGLAAAQQSLVTDTAEAVALSTMQAEPPVRQTSALRINARRLRERFPVALVVSRRGQSADRTYAGVIGPLDPQTIRSTVLSVEEEVWGHVDGSLVEQWYWLDEGAGRLRTSAERLLVFAEPWLLAVPDGGGDATAPEPRVFASGVIHVPSPAAVFPIVGGLLMDQDDHFVCLGPPAGDGDLFVDCPEGVTTTLEEAIAVLSAIPGEGPEFVLPGIP